MDQSSSATTAPTEFHPYPRLPNELKAKIWEYAFAEWSSGAHRFRLLIDPESAQEIILRPDKDNIHDASAWRERLSLARVDACSAFVFRLLRRKAQERKQLQLLYKDTSNRRRVRVEENGVVAEIDAETDLVTFRFNYGTTQSSLALLYPLQNMDVFGGITQVGIEFEYLEKGYTRRVGKSLPQYLPFQVQCNHRHPWFYSCCCGVAEFLLSFKELKTVYIIHSFEKQFGGFQTNYVASFRSARSLRQIPHGRRYKTRQHVLKYFPRLQALVQDKDLKQFHDRNGTYLEVKKDWFDYGGGNANFTKIENLASTWAKRAPQHFTQGNWRDVEFKHLVFTDLRGVVFSDNGQLLRRTGPCWN